MRATSACHRRQPPRRSCDRPAWPPRPCPPRKTAAPCLSCISAQHDTNSWECGACHKGAERCQSVLKRTGNQCGVGADQARWLAACAGNVSECAQAVKCRRYYFDAEIVSSEATSASASAPGVGRTKIAPVRLRSVIVRRSQQACGRTPPVPSAMCSAAAVSDLFPRDSISETVVSGYNFSIQ